MSQTTVKLTKRERCQFCMREALYDGKSAFGGQWAYMCESHFEKWGFGLGTGLGQRIEYVDV